MFKVNHFVNSFISIESDNSIFTCDPWIGKTTDNGWFSYPIKNCNQIEKKIFNSIPFLWAWSWLFFMQERFSQPDAT